MTSLAQLGPADAARALQHPASLVFSPSAVAALSAIADRKAPILVSEQRQLLSEVLALLRAAELAAARGPT